MDDNVWAHVARLERRRFADKDKDTQIVTLRKQLSYAVEELQIMKEQLDAAHNEIERRSSAPPPSRTS